MKNDANLVNSRTGGSERLAHIGTLLGKTITPVTEVRAGDIGAVAKLKETVTGDTLSPAAAEFLRETGCAALEKPFAPADLVARVRALLPAGV